MFRMKLLCAALLLAAITQAVPANANPTPPAACVPGSGLYGVPIVQAVIAGSSAMFQTVALGAYNRSNGVSGQATAPTFHYVSNSKFILADERPTSLGGTVVNSDTGTVWIVWDSKVTAGKCTPNVWIYLSTDSVVGNRAFFGSFGAPAGKGVYVQAPASFPADDGGSQISSTLWGDGSTGVVPDVAVQNLFSNATTKLSQLVNVGATDIRPEDAYFAINRVNTNLDATDGNRGLGYNSNNTAGTPPDLSTNCGGTSGLPQLQGTGILGDYFIAPATSEGPFNVLAFNITGQDPFTCANIGTYATIPVGASPIVVIHSNNGGQLKGLANVTTYELEQVFSGLKNGTPTSTPFGTPCSPTPCVGAFGAILREPLSGTYNTFEETTMRHASAISSYRAPQELGVGGAANNPLAGFDTFRWRAIGTGDMVKSVRDFDLGSGGSYVHGKDAIGYAFFSYGNVSPIKDNANYSYVTLNGVDPIWHNYDPTNAGTNPQSIVDPGQHCAAGSPPTCTNPAGTLPGVADLPASCGVAGSFPCNESNLWAADNFSVVNGSVFKSYSFPNLRNGNYTAWSIVRLITSSSKLAAIQKLVNTSNTYVVSTTPDYVPFDPVLDSTGTVVLDPGLQFLRSHFGCVAATCGTNSFTSAVNPPVNAPETGRDAGGSILPIGDTTTGFAQDGPASNWVISFM
jgi:hypothetical protein